MFRPKHTSGYVIQLTMDEEDISGREVNRTNKVLRGSNARVFGSGNTATGHHLTLRGDNNRGFGDDIEMYGRWCTGTGNRIKIVGPRGVIHGDDGTIQGPGGVLYGERGENTLGVQRTARRRVGRVAPSARREASMNEAASKRQRDAGSRLNGVICPPESEKANDVKAATEEETCTICVENKRKCITLPCGHLDKCVACSRDCVEKAERKPTCTQCRAPIREMKVVY